MNDIPSTTIKTAKGKHKIILGYAAGVGKTYSMLSEAHRRIKRGEDIVIGIVETHSRTETAKLCEGIEQIPRKQIEYRGSTFFELDTLAVIARKPECVLVDELAHTNIPGTQHNKRWQSVLDILDAGINVISTVNVQHIESLNDTIFDLTCVQVRERVPDSIIDSAEELELIDLIPEALINRLKRGDIYGADKIPNALTNFFKLSNLYALRELALRRTAEEVDSQLNLHYLERDSLPTSSPQEKVLVCVTPGGMTTKLVRRGFRLASRLNGKFWTIFIKSPFAVLNSSQDSKIQECFELTKELGGEVIVLEADSPADEIIKFAKTNQITFIVMGQSIRSRWEEIVYGSVITKIMRKSKGIDVLVVGDSK